MSRTRVMIIGIMAILLLALPLLTACGDDEDETQATEEPTSGATEEAKPDIHVGAAGLVTGKYAAYSPITWGYLDYIKDLNERGGIDGAQIKLHWKDCQYDVSQSLEAYSDFSKSHDLVAFSGMGTGANLALAPRCTEDEIVLLAIGGEPEIVWPAQDWVFATTPNHVIGALGAMQYVMEQWDEPDPPKVGIAYLAMAFGECILDPIKEYGKVAGYEVVETQEVPLTAVDAVSQALAFRAKDVDIVYGQLSMKPMSMLCKDMQRQGFEPKMVVGPFHVIHPAFSDLAGDTGEGVMAWNIFDLWPQDIDNPDVEYWRAKAVEYSSGDVVSEDNPYMATLYMWGLSIGVSLEAGLREAAATVGAENIDSKALRDALERVSSFETETSGFQSPVTFTAENHEAYRATSLMQVEDGAWVRLTDWFESPWEYTE